MADLCRGAVTEDLIIWLSKKFSHAKWYMYSKAWKPSWFRSKAVSGLDVRVVLVPSLAASAAVRDPEVSLSSWVTPQGSVSQAALSEVEDLSKSFPRARVVVLPQDMRVLAYDGTTRRGWVQPDTGLPDPQLFTPMATVFFPALVLGEILAEAKTAKDWIAPIRRALEFTHAWIDAEVGRLMTETWNPPLTQRFSVASRDSSATFPNWQPLDWQVALEQWQQGFRERGVVWVDKRPVFQLWRAMADLDGYICCVESRQKDIQKILELGRRFKTEGQRRHVSVLMTDSPGTGKSFLAKCLAQTLGLPRIEFNISQLNDP